MYFRSNKPIVKTLKELKIQKALGHDVVMCSNCEDIGIYETRDYGGSDTWNCESCEAGWKFIWKNWLKNKLGHAHYCIKCPNHNDYDGSERPTVLCDACWKIWFEAPPKKVKYLIQNVDEEISK